MKKIFVAFIFASISVTSFAAQMTACPNLNGTFDYYYNHVNADRGYDRLVISQESNSIYDIQSFFSLGGTPSPVQHIRAIPNHMKDPNPAQGFYSYCVQNSLITLYGSADAPGFIYARDTKGNLISGEGSVVNGRFVIRPETQRTYIRQ